MDKFRKINQAWWDERTSLHAQTAFYDVASFRSGCSSLRKIEIEELGDVQGKSLLHLQCHFGLDTLSWARHGGATVTGVDFSSTAIDLAQQLSTELDIPATFIQSDIYELPTKLTEPFDIVFTSYGVLNWLPDIHGWAKAIAHCLRSGGTFYMVEFHPLLGTFDYLHDFQQPHIAYPYFHDPEPDETDEEGSYMPLPVTTHANRKVLWRHTLGDIISALVAAGLRIEFLHEFPYIYYQAHSFLMQREDGHWHWGKNGLPLMFSIKAKHDSS